MVRGCADGGDRLRRMGGSGSISSDRKRARATWHSFAQERRRAHRRMPEMRRHRSVLDQRQGRRLELSWVQTRSPSPATSLVSFNGSTGWTSSKLSSSSKDNPRPRATAKGMAAIIIRRSSRRSAASLQSTTTPTRAASCLFQVTRHEPKDFRQRRPDGRGGWIADTRGVRMVPYRLPELVEAVAQEQTVYVLEGEKDVDNAVLALHVPATCNPRGAGKWGSCNIDRYFEGAHVVVVADNDPQTKNKKTGELLCPPGRSASLCGLGSCVRGRPAPKRSRRQRSGRRSQDASGRHARRKAT